MLSNGLNKNNFIVLVKPDSFKIFVFYCWEKYWYPLLKIDGFIGKVRPDYDKINSFSSNHLDFRFKVTALS